MRNYYPRDEKRVMMNLRTKTFLIVFSAICLGCIALAAIGNLVMMDGFRRLEIREAEFHVERVKRVVNAETDYLVSKAADWAHWEDAYEYVNGRKADFESSNMIDTLCSTLKVGLFLYARKSGEILSGKHYDYKLEKAVPLPKSLNTLLYPGSPISKFTSNSERKTGLVRLPEGVLMYGAIPVSSGDGSKETDAMVFIGTWLDDAAIKRFGETVQLNLELETFTAGNTPKAGSQAAALDKTKPTSISELSESILQGSTLFSDINGDPAALVTAKINRDIMRQGAISIRGFVKALAVGGFLFVIVLMLVLEKGIVSRISRLNKSVIEIGERSDLSARVPESGNDEIKVLSTSINGMLRIIEEKTQQMRTILANINQGIAMLDGKGEVNGDTSAAFGALTGIQRAEGRSILDLIFNRSSLSGDQTSQMNAFLMSTVGEDVLSFQTNSDVLPRQISITENAGNKRYLETDWQPIVSSTDVVERVMLTIRDVTELRALEEASERSRTDVERLIQVLNHPRQKIHKFIESSLAYVESIKDIIAVARDIQDLNDERRTTVRRGLHTIKGNARSLGLSHMTEVVHAAEDVVFPLLANSCADREQLEKVKGHLLDESRNVTAELDRYSKALERLAPAEVSGSGVSGADPLLVEEAVGRVVHFVDGIESLYRSNSGLRSLESMIAEGAQAKYAALRVTHPSLSDYVQDWESVALTVAKDLGRKQPEFQFDSIYDVIFTKDSANALADGLIHMVRNSVDHGFRDSIENPLIRLKLALIKGSEGLSIEYSDNGIGLNLNKIREVSARKGLDLSQNTDEALANLIFVDGVSTSEKVTQVSGRGTGMTAVRNFVENLGGRCELALEPGLNSYGNKSFKLNIILPKSSVLAIAEIVPSRSRQIAA